MLVCMPLLLTGAFNSCLSRASKSAVRAHPGIKQCFAQLHECRPDQLACSWDNPFYTPQATDSCSTQNACTQLISYPAYIARAAAPYYGTSQVDGAAVVN